MTVEAATLTTRFSGYAFIHEHLRRLATRGTAVLETGCGAGHYRRSVAGRYVGTDVTAQDYHVGIPRRCDVVCVAEALPFGEGTFDLVFNVAALDYMRDLDAAFKEARRVLRPRGGLLVFTYDRATLARIHRSAPEHRHVYGLAELLDRFRSHGFAPRLLDGPEPRPGWRRLLMCLAPVRAVRRQLGRWRVVYGTLN